MRVTKFFPEDYGVIGDHGSRTLLIPGAVNHKRQWDEFAHGIRAAFRPLPPDELAARRAALQAR